jgi:hypothetical protein
MRDQEDAQMLKERLNVIKDVDFTKCKNIERFDFDSVKDEFGNVLSHLIFISDEIRQFQNETL